MPSTTSSVTEPPFDKQYEDDIDMIASAILTEKISGLSVVSASEGDSRMAMIVLSLSSRQSEQSYLSRTMIGDLLAMWRLEVEVVYCIFFAGKVRCRSSRDAHNGMVLEAWHGFQPQLDNLILLFRHEHSVP